MIAPPREYVGGSSTTTMMDNSVVQVNTCNTARNGHGPCLSILQNSLLEDDDMSMRSAHCAVVPAGHSGVYVDAAQANLLNWLVAGNSLMGRVQRTENGSGPMVELLSAAPPQQQQHRHRQQQGIGSDEAE